MDGFTEAVVDTPVNSGDATATATPESSQGTEKVASENGEQAGGSKETPEGGPEQGQNVRQRGPSKLDTIRELRAKIRDQRSYWESEVGTLKQQLEEIQKTIASRTQGQKPSKTFWEAPEEVLDERFDSKLSAMEQRMLSAMEKRQTMDQQTSEWKQETSEAAEFIRSQKGITDEDQEDIAEIVRSTPAMANMRPMDRAKYAYFLWKEERGIRDTSTLKARASTVIGAPPSAGGQKTWTNAEIEAKVAEFNRIPMKDWTKEQGVAFDAFERDIRQALKDGRVKN